MTLQDLGALGELLGAVAVIASVLYLAQQIRHGLQGYRSVITQETTNHFSHLQMNIACDQDIARILWRAQQGETLDDLEVFRLAYLLSSYMIGFENLYIQHQAKMLDASAYMSRRMIMAGMLTNPGASTWWNQVGRHAHPTAFAAEVDAALRDYQAANA